MSKEPESRTVMRLSFKLREDVIAGSTKARASGDFHVFTKIYGKYVKHLGRRK
jgi:hypothetical protein